MLTTVPQRAPNYLAQRLKNGYLINIQLYVYKIFIFSVEISTTNNVDDDADLNEIELQASPNAKGESILQMALDFCCSNDKFDG